MLHEIWEGWKVSPSVIIKAHTTFTIAETSGSGAIKHIWMTPTGNWRFSILRFYWDDETTPFSFYLTDVFPAPQNFTIQ